MSKPHRTAIPILAAVSFVAQIQGQPIAFTNVTVVDVEKGTLLSGQTVVVEGAQIVAADDAGRVRVPRGSRVVSGKGRFLMPGLWDMHVHEMPSPNVPEVFLANGVTGVRDMYDDQAKLREVRQAIREGRRAGPRILSSGRTLNGEYEKNGNVVVRTAEEARVAVRQQVQEGVDFIKIYNALPREAFYAIADECKRRRVAFVGHTPDAVTTAEAAAAGQRSIEHLDGVFLDCSQNSAWLRQSRVFVPDRRMLDGFDSERAKRLFATYVRYGIWHCPTLAYYRSVVIVDDPALAPRMADPNLKLLGDFWRVKAGKKALSDIVLDRDVQQKAMEITAMMFRAGVRLLAGTDTGAPYVLPGFGLHDELELMVAAGIPADAVLRAATLGAAQFLGRDWELGKVSKGRLADLVLLDANPLQKIGNTRRIRAVVADGRFYGRVVLDRLLTEAAH